MLHFHRSLYLWLDPLCYKKTTHNAEAAVLKPKIILDPAAHIFHPASLPELNTPEPTAPQLPAHPSIQTPQ